MLDTFKGEILKRYDSESAFARALGWQRQKLNHFTTGARIPDLEDAKAMSDTLGIPISELVGFFLPEQSTNGDSPDVDILNGGTI